MIVCAIAQWGNAAEANVIYSSRGLWSVILVWLAGARFGSREAELAGSVLIWRFAGAALMLFAIALALF